MNKNFNLPYSYYPDATESSEPAQQTEEARNIADVLDRLEDQPVIPGEPYPKDVIASSQNVEDQQSSAIKTEEKISNTLSKPLTLAACTKRFRLQNARSTNVMI